MYCKHCYKMIEDGADICPACGKAQTEKKRSGKAVRILLGIGTWFASMLLLAIIGSALNLAAAGGLISSIYSLAVVVIPILLAFKIALPKKSKKSTTTPQAINGTVTPIPGYAAPQESAKATAEKEKSTAHADEVNLIVESLHQGTFKETIQELYGERVDAEAPSETIQVVSEPAKPQPVAKSNTNPVISVTHNVTGISHYMDNIMKLAHENSDYDMSKREIVDSDMIDEKIWKYSFYPAKTELIPEPDNPKSPKAIKVIVDRQHVGYIKEGSCSKVLKAINENRIRGIDCTIGGGPYKTVYEEDDGRYEVECDESRYFVQLTVYEANS